MTIGGIIARNGFRFLRELAFYCTISGVLVSPIQTATANPRAPYQIVHLYDSESVNVYFPSPSESRTLVLLGDSIDLADIDLERDGVAAVGPIDIVIVARRVKIGPRTGINLSTKSEHKPIGELRGGDIYIASPEIQLDVDESKFNIPRRPWKIYQKGGRSPKAGWQGRHGQVHVFTDGVSLSERFLQVKRVGLESGLSPTPIPKTVIKALARDFSDGNSIHHFLNTTQDILWTDLGSSMESWLEQEPAHILVARELGVWDGAQSGGFRGEFKKAKSLLPSEILVEWYNQVMPQLAGVAEMDMLQSNYEDANARVQEALKLMSGAPAAAIAGSTLRGTIERLRLLQGQLQSLTFVDHMRLQRDGLAPLDVMVIKDYASRRVDVLPNMLVFSAMKTDGSRRVGFVSGPGRNGLEVVLRGKLTIDSWVMQKVRETITGSGSIISAEGGEIEYLGITLPDIGKKGSASISAAGEVEIRLQLSDGEFAQEMARLSQVVGMTAFVDWRHQRLQDHRLSPIRVSVSLSRSDADLVASGGQIRNGFSTRVIVDYVIDGSEVRLFDPPKVVEPSEVLEYSCKSNVCYSPGTAFRHEFAWDRPFDVLIPVNNHLVTADINIENHLTDDTALGGSFRHARVELVYKPTADATPQVFGPFNLAKRGELGSKVTIRVIGAPLDDSELALLGSGHWGEAHFQDLARVWRGPVRMIQLDSSVFRNTDGPD